MRCIMGYYSIVVWIQNQFLLSVFVFIDCFVVSALQDAGGYATSRLPVVRTDGLSVYGHVIAKFSRMGILLHFLTNGAPLARFARESSAKKVSASIKYESLDCID